MVMTIATIEKKLMTWFYVKRGVLHYYISPVIMHGITLDYEKHWQIPFGAYVQVFDKSQPSNNQFGRTIDAIYLEPM